MNKYAIQSMINDINVNTIKPSSIGTIYSISANGDLYIGKTSTSLSIRSNGHNQSFEKYKKNQSKRWCKSTYVMEKNERCTMNILDIHPIYNDDDKKKLFEHEQQFIYENDCVNKNDERNDEKIEEYIEEDDDDDDAEDEQTNKNCNCIIDIPIEFGCVYKIYDVDGGGVYIGKQANNEYNHRPEVKEHRTELYLLKKENETEEERQHRKQVQKERKSQIVECCGTKMTRNSLTAHKKTKKHIENNPIGPSL
jgi:hypothetical protein